MIDTPRLPTDAVKMRNEIHQKGKVQYIIYTVRTLIIQALRGEHRATEFLRRLLKDQEAVIQRDLRLHGESIARGKYSIGYGPQANLTVQFIANGAPLKIALMQEANFITEYYEFPSFRR